MIPISFNSVPIEYVRFIQKFRRKIQGWYRSGVMGNAKAKVDVCQDCKLFFELLLRKDHLKTIMTAKASDLPRIIKFVEYKFPQLKNDREHPNEAHSELYNCLNKAFYTLGYNDVNFPNYRITESLGLKACPYCNQEEIIYEEIHAEDGCLHKIMNSELDHFYPRSRVPYLAVSLFNLVPSGSICNGGTGKHEKDTYAEELVNPHTLREANGIEFRLDVFRNGVLDYETFTDACKIKTITNDQTLVANRNIFNIIGRYEHELDKAKYVWMNHKMIESEGYKAEIARLSRQIDCKMTIKEWLNFRLQIDSSNYNEAKLSKFVMDIWNQLDNQLL